MKAAITVWQGNKDVYSITEQIESVVTKIMENTEKHILITIKTIDDLENN